MTISLQKFIDENNGKFKDFDKAYGPQCVDLIRYYLRDVIGISAYAIPAAKWANDMFNKFPDKGDSNFIKIYNAKDNWPIFGDVVFSQWKLFGVVYRRHVSLATKGNIKTYISFDQNWPEGFPCRYTNHNYSGTLGWLRPVRGVR